MKRVLGWLRAARAALDGPGEPRGELTHARGNRLHVPTAGLWDRDVRGGRARGTHRGLGCRAGRARRGGQRALEPAAARCARNDRAGRSRRLRAHGTHARAARRRRRPAPARVRHLRRPGRRVRALVRPQPLAAARGDPAYRALRADAASGGCPHRALQRGRARDRDDRDGAPAARLLGRLPRGEGACRAARSPEPAHGPCRERARRARLRRLRRHGRPVPALHVRAALGRQGSRDDDRRHARDRRAPSGDGLRDRRAHASRHRAGKESDTG